MRTIASLLLFILHSALCIPHLEAADAPVPTKDAAAKFTVPPGFQVKLFAGEPDVVQPIAFTFDDRGRMWVVECLMYPKWSQDGKGGKDRVIILEDTDGDGVFDKKTVVIDNGVNLSGIEWGFGGIYLCSSPNLIFVPIVDDKPGKQEILLDGWNIKDAKHNVFNSLIWGPDGWLYGCNGIQTKSYVGTPGTPKENRQLFDCGVWKFHPTKKVFEVVANGTTNPFGLDFDEHGEMFITNCVIDHLFHVVPGGHYTRMYGNDPNPFVYGAMGSAVDYKHWGGGDWGSSRADQKTGAIKKEHSDAGGGHAHSGCAIYQGENFPPEYRNTLFTCNIHGNRLNNDGLERTKTGMKGVRRPDFAFANDPWFRGICVKQGPEGALYVSDWSDTGECHNYDKADVTNGRIYRISFGDVKAWKGDVSKFAEENLVKAVTSKNEWLSRQARRLLQERTDEAFIARSGYICTRMMNLTKDQQGGGLDQLGVLSRQFSEDFDKTDAAKPEQVRQQLLGAAWVVAKAPKEKIRIAWALFATRRLESKHVEQLIKEDSECSRIWGLRLASEQFSHSTQREPISMLLSRQFYQSASTGNAYDFFNLVLPLAKEQSDLVRLHLYGSLQKTDNLLRRVYLKHASGEISDSNPNLAMMHWFALSPLLATNEENMLYWLSKAPGGYARRNIVRRFLTTPKPDYERIEEVAKFIEGLESQDKIRDLLLGMKDALVNHSALHAVEGWRKLDFGKSPSEVRRLADEISLLFNDEVIVAKFIARSDDAKFELDDRMRAIALLANRKTGGFEKSLLKLLSDPAVRQASIRGLAHYNDPDTPKAILDVYSKLTAEEKADAVQTLASRPAYATALLEAVEKGTVPKADLTAFTARQIAALKDKTVVAKLEKVWGKVQPASAVRVEQMKKYKSLLTPEFLTTGSALNGKAVFTKNCATCHKMYGEGQSVGPELTGSQRSNLDYILENVVDPSAVVANEYKMTSFYLVDGRIVQGIVKGENANAVTVRTVNEEMVIAKKEIEDRKGTNLSVMPEGLFDAMKPEDVRDLVAFLMAKEPPK